MEKDNKKKIDFDLLAPIIFGVVTVIALAVAAHFMEN